MESQLQTRKKPTLSWFIKPKLLLAMLWSLLCFTVSAQVLLIDPAGDGGFETGTTFAANGWSVSNSANNPWIIGTAVATAPFANRSVYISDNGSTNTYTPNNQSLNYFWRDVTVVSPNDSIIKLSFNWISNGEAPGWDIWQVWTAPTSVTPVGSTTHPGNSTTTVYPGITGATFVGFGVGQGTPQTAVFTLPKTLAGTTFRLIFSWKNETGGTQPPASIDNIRLIARPAVVPDPPVNISFSAPGKSVMTVNWEDNSTNEDGFRVYRSTDPVTGFTQIGGDIFTTTIAGTGTTYSLINTGLNPSVTYYYRVYSFADDTSITSLTGSQITDPPGYVSTTATGGNWSAASTWVGGGLPTASDTAVVVSGATLVVDAAVSISKMMLDAGSTVYMTNTLVDSTDLVIASGATFNAFYGTAGRQLTVRGNIDNAGSLNMGMPGASLVMNGTNPQAIGGAGTFSHIPRVTLNNVTGLSLNTNLTVSANLDLTNGVLGGTGTLTLGNTSFSNGFTMTSAGGHASCTIASALAGVATVTYNYNASSPVASYTTGTELSITVPNLNVNLAAVAGGNIILGSDATVNNLTFNDTLLVDAPYTVTVNGNAAFTAAPVVMGTGTFTMGANGTLTTANLAGLTSSGLGSVQTSTRNYSATGNYTFNGAATQVTGNGLPILLTGGTVTSGTTSGLTLSQATTFNNLTLTTDLLTNGADVTVNNIANLGTLKISGAGGFTAGAASRLLLNNTHASGVIQSAPSTDGNIINTGTRIFNTGLDIVLGGSAAATGDAFPLTGIDSLVLNQTTTATLTGAISVNTLYITATGRLTTTAANTLTVLGTASGNVARTGPGYIDGPLTRTVSTGAAGGYLFPLGAGATGSLGIELINPVVSGGNVTLTAIATDLSSGGTANTGLTAINTNRYWAFASVTGAGTLTGVGNIRIYETNAAGLGSAKKVGIYKGSTSAGSYDAIGGLIDSNSLTITSSLTVPAFSISGDSTFFVLGAGPASGGAFAGGTYTVGPTGSYFSLTSAIAAINESTSLTGPVVIEFQTTYNPNVETYPIVFRSSLPTSAANTITIRPSAGVVSPVNFSAATVNTLPLFDFNGGKYITIDGRAGGAGTDRLIGINQLQNAGGYPAVRFINDAQSNVLRRLNLSSMNTTLNSSGIVFFSTTNAGSTAANGNSNDTIEYCNFDARSTSPNCIFANGTAAPADNKNVVISNCNMYDFYFNGSSEIFAIRISGGNTGWTISENNFYQTVARTSTSIPVFNPAINIGALQINNTAGNGFNIINNTFGGNIPGIPGSVFILGDSTTNTTTGNGVIRPFDISGVGSTVPTLIQGNTISDITYYASSNGAECFVGIGVYGGACNMINNTIGSSTGNDNIKIYYRGTAAPSAVQGFRHNAGGSGSIIGNTMGSITAQVQGAQATGYIQVQGIQLNATTFATPLVIANNTIGSATTANSIMGSPNSVGAVSMMGIFDNGATGSAITITSNTIANLSSFSNAVSNNNYIRGIYATGGSSVSTSITGNTIRNLTVAGLNNATDVSSTITGISNSKSGTGTQWIAGNTIHSLISTNGLSYGNNIAGIYYSSTSTGAGNRIEMNFIHSLQTASSNALAAQQGIVSANGSARAGIYNNMIRLGIDVAGASITGSHALTGISKTGGIVSVFNNSVYIGGTAVASGAVNTFAFNKTSNAVDSVFNNIFVNARSNTSGTGTHYAVGANSNTTFTANNNLYFANGTGGVTGVFGGTDQPTAGAWKAASGGDVYSFSADPAFIAPAGSVTTLDLHISTSIGTPVEGAGAVVAGVPSDFDGQDRSTLTPVDLGADAGNFILTDLVPPAIVYTPLTDALVSANTLGNVIITDASGVNTTAGTKPRIYYKKKTEDNAYVGNTNADNGWKYVEASNSSSPFSFTMNYALLTSTAAIGDTIQYFVVAQDVATPVHVAVNNGIFAIEPATVALTAAAFPVTGTINSFKILAGLSGTLTVGSSAPGDYLTLTSAIADINNKIITAPLVLELIDSVYAVSTGETFPVVISSNVGSSPTNTLTIRPASGVNAIIRDSITHTILDLNGVDYLVLDGRQGGTGTPNSLSIINRSKSNVNYGTAAFPANIPNAVRFINDATFNTLQYINMLGTNQNEASGVVFFSVGISVGNSNNTIDHCNIGNIPGDSITPFTLFLGQGSVDLLAKYNKYNVISNNNLYNYFNKTGESNAFKVSKGNTDWTITGNHTYQTEPRTGTGTAPQYFMNMNRRVDYTTGHADNAGAFISLNNMVITNNIIGGSGPNASGAPWTVTGPVPFGGGWLEFGNTGMSRVSNNTFTNFVWNATATGEKWYGLRQVCGWVSLDSNTIGSETISNAIIFNVTAGAGSNLNGLLATPGPGNTPSNTFSISGNKMGGITLNGAAASSATFIGITINSATNIHTYMVDNNIIGNSLADNIQAPAASTSGTAQSLTAIFNTSTANIYMRDNTIRNFRNNYEGTAAGLTQGISTNATGIDTITGNNISNLYNASPQTGTNMNASVAGMAITSGAGNAVINNNTVHGLYNTNTTAAAVQVSGIFYNGGNNDRMMNNTVSDLFAASASAAAQIFGVNYAGGNVRFANNMISIGDTNGTAFTNTPVIAGVYKNGTGSMAAYFNTVFIDGANVGTGTANTYAFRRNAAGTDTLKNNIFINQRSNAGTGGGHYAVSLVNNTTLASDYNLMHVEGSLLTGDTLIVSGTTPYLALADWQTASSLDANSKDTVVAFVSVSDLHLDPAMHGLFILSGTSVDGIATDIDGDSRTTFPYVGADEITSAPLPVKLLSFKAALLKDDVLLTWNTASEINNKGFIVERSASGKGEWKQIGFVKGNNNSNRMLSYQHTDHSPFTTQSTLYYRLRQVDNDGKESISEIAAVSKTTKQIAALSAFPNPFTDEVNVVFVSSEENNAVVEVVDITGKLISTMRKQVVAGVNQLTVNETVKLQPGVYFLSVTMNGEKQILKLIKQ